MVVGMKTNATLLSALLNATGYNVYADYSGRGMGSATCLAVDIHPTKIGTLWADLMLSAIAEDDDDAVSAVVSAMRSHRVDGMGHEIVVYFPQHKTESAAA